MGGGVYQKRSSVSLSTRAGCQTVALDKKQKRSLSSVGAACLVSFLSQSVTTQLVLYQGLGFTTDTVFQSEYCSNISDLMNGDRVQPIISGLRLDI